MEKLETIIACNLIYLRKQAKLTQLEFGEKFNYSDKTVSKWELGTVVPSVQVLKQIAEFYNVSVDYILTEHKSQKDYNSEIAKVVNPQEKFVMMGLALTIVWFIATAFFVVSLLQEKSFGWLAFVWAIPLSFLVLAFMCRRYFRKSISSLIFSSLLVWTLLASVYLYLVLVANNNYWFTFIIGLPIQAMIALLIVRRKSV